MAGKKKQQPQQPQQAQQAQGEVHIIKKRKASSPEVAELMKLSFAEIDELPKDKKQLVYAEIGRQIAEDTGLQKRLETTMAGIKSLTKMPQETAETLQAFFRQLDTAREEWRRRWDALQKQYDFSKLAETMQQLAEAGPTLQPYIDRIYDADPERWKHASIPELYAAAAKAAREDGQEVPPLWFETEGEQLAMQLDLPGEPAASKEKGKSITPAELLETIKTVQAIDPAAHVMPNNALMNALTQKPAINAGAFDLVVANEQARRKEITNYTIVNYDPGDSGITITDPKLSEYERQVSDAVISLWAEAKRQNMPPVFTVDMIYQSMPGGGDRPQPAQRAAITRTIEKLRRLHIYMDATEEMRKRGKIGAGATFTMDSFYFQVDRAEYKARNSRQSVTAYKMESAPIMLTYSQMTGQLLTVQARYLDIRKVKAGLISPEVIPATAGRQAMAGYMLRRIAVMRHDEEAARDALRQHEKRRKKETDLEAKPLAAFRKQSRVILFDTIFAEAGTVTTDRKQAGLNRAYCYEVLEYWQAAGLIKGYAEQRKGKKITGFSVTV